jgi:hypothetical protein
VLSNETEKELSQLQSELVFLGFALTECTVNVDSHSVKYLRAVHRTALELAIHNRFGVEIGGFWLTMDQIAQLRALADYYPPNEAAFVAQAIEAYLAAQLEGSCCASC